MLSTPHRTKNWAPWVSSGHCHPGERPRCLLAHLSHSPSAPTCLPGAPTHFLSRMHAEFVSQAPLPLPPPESRPLSFCRHPCPLAVSITVTLPSAIHGSPSNFAQLCLTVSLPCLSLQWFLLTQDKDQTSKRKPTQTHYHPKSKQDCHGLEGCVIAHGPGPV